MPKITATIPFAAIKHVTDQTVMPKILILNLITVKAADPKAAMAKVVGHKAAMVKAAVPKDVILAEQVMATDKAPTYSQDNANAGKATTMDGMAANLAGKALMEEDAPLLVKIATPATLLTAAATTIPIRSMVATTTPSTLI